MTIRSAFAIVLVAGAGAIAVMLLVDRPQSSPAPVIRTDKPETRLSCPQEVDATRTIAAALPPDDLTRRYAEADLTLAQIEANGGEIADCRQLVERAVETLRTHRYALRPGQTLALPPEMAPSRRASE